MTPNTLKALYKNYCGKYSEGCAFDMLLEKYPEFEGELYAIRDGEDMSVPAEMKFKADETFYDDEVNEMEMQVSTPEVATAVFNTIVETATEVNEGKAPVIEKTAKKKAEKVVKAPKIKAEKPVKEPKGPSKAEQARAIYAAAEDKSRAAVTKLFVEQLGLTAAGASTYFQNCKKAG